MRSNHKAGIVVNWAFPLFFMSLASFVIIVFQKVFAKHLRQWGFALESGQIMVDEDLPDFFESIKIQKGEELIAEQKNMKENFGFIHNDPDTIEILEKCHYPDKAMQQTPWYQILSNPDYAQKFCYYGAFITEREKLIEDGYVDVEETDDLQEQQDKQRCAQSDMTMILLNLAYIPDEVAQHLDFKSGWHLRFKKAME